MSNAPKELFALIADHNGTLLSTYVHKADGEAMATDYYASRVPHTIHRYTLDEWIPVGERPGIGVKVILLFRKGIAINGERVGTGSLRLDNKWVTARVLLQMNDVVGWRAMPAPSREGE